MVAMPAAIGCTIPDAGFTSAIAVLLLDHMPPGTVSLKATGAVPAQRGVMGVMIPASGYAGSTANGLISTKGEPGHELLTRYLIIVVPDEIGDRYPVRVLIVATPVDTLVHVPPAGLPVRVIGDYKHVE